MNYFITAIDTNIGKTILSSVLVQKLGYDYWKPIQSGIEYPTDTETLQSLVLREDITYFPEAYRLINPLSPHASAAMDNITIDLAAIIPPKSSNLIIEGAGGVLVPINHKGETMLDIIKKINCEVIIVSKNYLGSINHTLLTCSVLKNAHIKIKGIVIMGESNVESEQIICKITQLPILFHLPKIENLNKDSIANLTSYCTL